MTELAGEVLVNEQKTVRLMHDSDVVTRMVDIGDIQLAPLKADAAFFRSWCGECCCREKNPNPGALKTLMPGSGMDSALSKSSQVSRK